MPVRCRTRFLSKLHLIHQLPRLSADQVTNLREDILIHRLKYSLTSMDEAKGEVSLNKAVKALEK